MTTDDQEICRVSDVPGVTLFGCRQYTLGPQKGPYCVASKDRTVVYYIGTLEGCHDYLRRMSN